MLILAKTTRSLDAVIEDIRRYILNLKVATYEQKTTRECLVGVVSRLHVLNNLSIEINAPDRQPPFPPPVMEGICQIAYEAISNIVRHAQATKAVIEVTEGLRRFQMVVRDNGRGIKRESLDNPDGLGLHNIMQRARIYGGEVLIDTPTEGGTRLTLKLPF